MEQTGLDVWMVVATLACGDSDLRTLYVTAQTVSYWIRLRTSGALVEGGP